MGNEVSVPILRKTLYRNIGVQPQTSSPHCEQFCQGCQSKFARIVLVLNSARLSQGHKLFSFLSPFIYRYSHEGLTDIVSGRSMGCNGTDMYSGLLHHSFMARI